MTKTEFKPDGDVSPLSKTEESVTIEALVEGTIKKIESLERDLAAYDHDVRMALSES